MRNQRSYPPRYQGPGADYESSEIDTEDELEAVRRVSHGLSQQGVWVLFWTPKPLKRTPQDTPKNLCGISKNLNLKLIIEFSHLFIIPMTLFSDVMPYFDEFIHVYG